MPIRIPELENAKLTDDQKIWVIRKLMHSSNMNDFRRLLQELDIRNRTNILERLFNSWRLVQGSALSYDQRNEAAAEMQEQALREILSQSGFDYWLAKFIDHYTGWELQNLTNEMQNLGIHEFTVVCTSSKPPTEVQEDQEEESGDGWDAIINE